MSKARVLILGGTGFIGRNLVQLLLEKELTSKIRVADKVLPALAALSEAQKALFAKVEFKQVNLARQTSIEKVFDDEQPFDIVFNLASETKYSQDEKVYQENIVQLSRLCGLEAAKRNVKRFVELSTAQVYDSGTKPRKEDAKLKPWTGIAKAKAQAEEELKKIAGLNLIIVRPAIIYGPGDIAGLMPRLVTAAVYKAKNEKMEFLWDKDLRINTVHVRDLVAALWHLSQHAAPGSVYNVADQNDTTQGNLCPLLESLFGIQTGFMGTVSSKMATSVAMSYVTETANEKHLKPWSDLCRSHNISSSCLTPFLDEELLYNNQLSVDGTAILATGFSYEHPRVTADLLKESIQYHVDNGAFPAEFFSK